MIKQHRPHKANVKYKFACIGAIISEVKKGFLWKSLLFYLCFVLQSEVSLGVPMYAVAHFAPFCTIFSNLPFHTREGCWNLYHKNEQTASLRSVFILSFALAPFFTSRSTFVRLRVQNGTSASFSSPD